MSSALSSGSRLGRFQLLWELGRGGMASVWIAREHSTQTGKQRLLAVKAMLPKLAQRPDFRSMFLDEGQLVRSIEHPSVVRVYEVGENRGILYLAMEWVEGDSLYALIKAAKERRAVPPEEAVRIIADTAAGLHVAHELRGWDGELRGVVHCDVSPQNILVGMDGQTKLVDFGVAHAATHIDGDGAGDRIAGKAGYMSPEQVLGESLDRRSDLFSLGIVLFELTTGKRLFRGRDRAHSMHLVHVAEIPRPTALHPDYPAPLEAIVLKALERDRERRFQTAEEFSQALERYLVAERIMVTRSSVGGLLKRVLGQRIQERRNNIRGALHALRQGSAPEGAEAGSMPEGEVSLPSLSLMSGSSLSRASLSSTGTESVSARQSSQPPAVSPAVAEASPRKQGSALKVVVPVAVLAIGAAGAYFMTQKRTVSVTRISVSGEAAGATPARTSATNKSDPASGSEDGNTDAGTARPGAADTRAGQKANGKRPGRRTTSRAEPDDPASAPTSGDKPAAGDRPSPAAGPTGQAPAAPTGASPAAGDTPASPRPPKKQGDEPDFSNPYR